MNDEPKKPFCLACNRESDATPLVMLEYRGTPYWICPQHLPILIHDPAQLIGKLDGAEELRPSDYHDCPLLPVGLSMSATTVVVP